ncbi:MAG: hypothetical protein KC468_22835, partial [Myxococcales bacterium]|nr:hypothetical protein [Myxococcales bacterium]
SSAADWEERLQVLFSRMLVSKAHYLQVRYIGIADGGRELVRVDRATAGAAPRVIPRAALQQKGRSAYMTASSALRPGETYFSTIDLNREHDQIVTPWQPVLRVATPIFDERGALYGLVIINGDMRASFERLAALVDPAHTYYVSDASGFYLRHPDPARTFGFETGEPATGLEEFPPLRASFTSDSGVRTEIVDGRVVSARALRLGPPERARRLGIVVTDTLADTTTVSAQTRQQLALVILALLLAAVLVGFALARQLSRPILRLAKIVEEDKAGDAALEIPAMRGEAGVLADAIRTSWRHRQHATALEASNRELKQFAYVASHDLQEPLRTISNYVALLDEEHRPQLDDEARRYMDFIQRACARMQALIHGLLEYSRLGRDVEFEPVDLEELLGEVLADLHASVREAGVALEHDPLPVVYGYRLGLRLLLQNLLSNAIRFRHPDRAPAVRISAERRGARWEVTVADNGLGIAPEHRERVFLLFQRLHTQREIPGTGIGLAYSRKIMEIHQGRIWVDESPSGGAAFHFTVEDRSA